ncbi:MAG: hypothetical protein OXP71_08070 [Candidatus Poribacteria bacterium]|nr:hypothetical protein [Candidatus Poribacteria bacterium]
MKYTHKLAYMTLGGFLMLIGMITATMFLPNLVAQQSDSQTASTEGDHQHITTFKTIVCNKIIVVDRTGRPAVFLDANNGGNASLWGKKGIPTITLSSINNAGRLHIYDKTGQPVIDLHTTDTGGTVTATANTGKAVAILGIGDNNKGFIKTNGYDAIENSNIIRD